VPFQSESSTNALRELERLTDNLRVGVVISNGVYQSVSAIDNIFVSLGRQLLNNDDFGLSVGSEEELVFRTARLIVDTQLGRIEQAIRSMLASSRPEAIRADVWSRLLEAIPCARDELQRVTSIWLPHRDAKTRPTATSEDAAAYTKALHTAFCELRKMDEIPEVERLLYRGVASKSPEIADACEQILVAIQVRIDLRALRRFWAARSNWERALGRR
jgi:hypothetical protein